MENETNYPLVAYPQLSTEQKLTVRELNYKLVKVREDAANLIKTAETNLVGGVQSIASELGLKDIPCLFNFDTLTFSGK
jgi:hypothetical protein